ncbi:MAG: ribosome small subunit-dependent GTPase A [Cohaesibacteraceae bacterium]|nr:ribosome small subunit-dependent GTPase A [Cohaesibacteraceae bacterium]
MTKTGEPTDTDQTSLPTADVAQLQTLEEFGWKEHFQSQISLDEMDEVRPVRISAVHRGHLDVIAPYYRRRIPSFGSRSPLAEENDRPVVGDWVLIDRATHVPSRLLDRLSVFRRKAPGKARKVQLLAANIDTVFIVTSCNLEFSPARLERYLTLAHESSAYPVVVLTKTDLCNNVDEYVSQAKELGSDLIIELVNSKDATSTQVLLPWCTKGQTVALLGSSGVGKSTIVNTLIGDQSQRTGEIREIDSRGRHTTSGRSLHLMHSGGWLVDTPGMRELQILDSEKGIAELFNDIEDLIANCKFSNCAHISEPGCAIQKAIESGDLDLVRWDRFEKLRIEDMQNSQTIAQRHENNRVFNKVIKIALAEKRDRYRDGDL